MPDSAPENPPSTHIDTSKPSIARAYDAMLGGKDNYELDRQLVAGVLQQAPGMYTVTRDNRQWLIRAVRYLAHHAGIDQFIDCGSGLPTSENTHEAVQRINQQAEVVYIDNDPIVLAHGRALLEENDRTHFASCDFRSPEALFSNPTLTKYIDLTRPVALLHVGSLHHLVDSEDPYGVIRQNIDALASGSYIAITHFCNHVADPALSHIAQTLENFLLGGDLKTGRFRTEEEIARFFDGLELIEPGVVPLVDWWPDGPRMKPLEAEQRLMIGGIGRKP